MEYNHSQDQVYCTENFTCRIKEVAQAAEKARRDIAVELFGKPFPKWNKPCPIIVELGKGAGGATSFHIDRGEVYGWSMRVQARDVAELNRDVIPHEVCHTVMYTHFRRPIPRWADEGFASQYESKPVTIGTVRTDELLSVNEITAIEEYPRDGRKTAVFYWQSYWISRFLVQLGGRPMFVEFLKNYFNSHSWNTALQQTYKIDSVKDLQSKWYKWHTAGDQRGMLSSYRGQNKHPEFVIYGRPGSGVLFTLDWNLDIGFRNTLRGTYGNPVFVNVNRYPGFAQQNGINNVPSFQIGDCVVEGYEGKRWLVARLRSQCSRPRPQPSPQPTDPPQPQDIDYQRIADLVVDRMEGNPVFRGPQGPKGEPGDDGKDGRGIASIESTGSMASVTYTDGTTEEFRLPSGADGEDGQDGRGIQSVSLKADELVIRYTDGKQDRIDLPEAKDQRVDDLINQIKKLQNKVSTLSKPRTFIPEGEFEAEVAGAVHTIRLQEHKIRYTPLEGLVEVISPSGEVVDREVYDDPDVPVRYEVAEEDGN